MPYLEDPYPNTTPSSPRLVLLTNTDQPLHRHLFHVLNEEGEPIATSTLFRTKTDREAAMLHALNVLSEYGGEYWMLRLGWMKATKHQEQMRAMLMGIAASVKKRSDEESQPACKYLLETLRRALLEQAQTIDLPTTG